MSVRVLTGDCRDIMRAMDAESVDCIVTSPPYWGLRDYGTASWQGGEAGCDHTGSDRYYTEKTAAVSSSDAFIGPGEANAERLRKGRWREGGTCTKCGATHRDRQLGLEASLGEHIATMVDVFEEARRVLKKTGTLWLNYGDSYATSVSGTTPEQTKAKGDDRTFRTKPFCTIGNGLKPKDLCMVPARLAIALQEAGWWLRSEIIWHKPNPMPESTRDRPTSAHEKIYLLAKSERYFYDAEAIAEPVAPSQIGRIRDDIIGGKSWKERQQHSIGGTYETRASQFGRSRTDGSLLALAGEPGIRAGSAREGGGPLPAGPEMARPDELFTGQFRNRVSDKQRGYGRRHAGFNDRWDATEEAEQCSGTRNKRNVWTVPSSPFSWGKENVRRVRVASDALDDGKKRITSPDCPIHGDLAGRSSTASCDEREDDVSIHTGSIDSHPDSLPLPGSAPIDHHHEPAIAQPNSNLPDQQYSVSARRHNSGSHRTDRAPETSSACTASAQMSDHIPDKSAISELFDSVGHMPASSNGQDGSADHPSARTPDRIAGKCTCEHYIEVTEKSDHFATFPPALIEPCILAGCPKGGLVLDPFGGAGTTGLVADRLGRNAILIELNPTYAAMAMSRVTNDLPLFAEVMAE